MEHTRDLHYQYVSEMCRTCGQLNLTKKDKKQYKKPFSSVDLSDDIFLVFGIDVSKDNDCFSKYVCHKCKASISTWKKRGSVTTIKAARTVAQTTNAIWCDFDEIFNELFSVLSSSL